ncbi:glutamate-5-semialdehyde dehydrogenase [Sediminibacillus dalangtanensis]|uniref:Gamma-glutamyl phosphate reductase n=1 Tax=Sediminibacillus dalangtanensis TaxID=2729421 RepID=A0ABX7VST1_9BACI|nr:glutamate-5-semialdehyde dehydrogenase [Sediminibacillus dalangtanensis]QTM99563.1 glutamate-5-semialdehyde dehydrogenase [Sediminibacillus dalangtanensis]
MSELLQKASLAKQATLQLSTSTTKQKNEALQKIADQVKKDKELILEANKKDLAAARSRNLSESIADRILLTKERLTYMADAVENLIDLTNPVGQSMAEWVRPNGLKIKRISVPIGVVGMIYEARPNVTLDAACLCLKTGNAILLRGSSSASFSNRAIVKSIRSALENTELPLQSVQQLEDKSRETVREMLRLNEYLDVLIPRGGRKLIDTVVQEASVPVIETGAGNCHLYIDATANVEMAVSIAINAKTQRPSVCNAIETIVVHRDWANSHLDLLIDSLQQKSVIIKGDKHALERSSFAIEPAEDVDWAEEYLDNMVALKIVTNIWEAIDHINHFSSKHSEAIISESIPNVEAFFQSVDAAALYHNASTRFTDGFEFGFGAEIGISTQKLHARGPMGLSALTSYKYLIEGDGQVKC